jgi:GT2 family glycosyltransferase
VIIVNYRQWDNTADLVQQLMSHACLRHEDAEVVIVDNHSPGHQHVRRLRRLPGVSLRRWNKNHGFAQAVNEGCRLSRGDWFLLLNPDMTLADGFLDQVLETADRLGTENPRAGIVGFHLRNPDGSRQLSFGPFPSLWSTLARLFLPRARRKYQKLRVRERCQVSWVTGCCLLVRRDCLRDVGGLDPNFFLYYEDVDLCRRARSQGWSVWYDPTVTAVHHHPLHSRPVPAALRLVTRHSLMTYAAKHWPRRHFRLLCRIVCAEAWARRLAAWWAGDTRHVMLFAELAALAQELLQGDAAGARRRLERTVQKLDLRLGV